jgi:transglutaminase-like putative cysteine protease
MPRVQIVHTTQYRYANPVRFLDHRLMLRPRDSHDLRLRSATLGLFPPAAHTRWAHDVFSNSIAHVDFGEAEAETLSIVSTLDLEHYPSAAGIVLDPIAETIPFSYGSDEFPDIARVLERHYGDPERKIDAWARRFLNKSGETRTMDTLVAMNEAIKAEFTYAAREDEGTNPPVVTLASKTGACRDFALFMMEAARSLGFAARFISGYLYDAALVDSVDPMVGGGATHAWCAIYLPGAGWVEFDPTNGLVAGRNLIRVSVARQPGQAVPISGGFVGRRDDFVGMRVDVAVRVGHEEAEVREMAEAETEAAAAAAD